MSDHEPEPTQPVRPEPPEPPAGGGPSYEPYPPPASPSSSHPGWGEEPPTTPWPTQQWPQQPPPPPQQPPPYWTPAYLPAYPTGNHGGAQTAMTLGIVGLVGTVGAFVCCATLPLAVCSPVAWVLGARARGQIRRAAPGTYGNEGAATAGLVMGVVGTLLLVLAIVGMVLLFGFVMSVPTA
ncbi:DUF4190 domain-containing protein [Nocardioides sp. SYSU D00038]|uniref:DUF4190 domain-containing protein n=1 Tax=Nocardioides sp. SYSU D00038 TaxID=2812554 RepID=UPI0019681382|nr:DUF4190 domain-containing protein [Nocardioides sp. SYSU D00038]